MTLPAPPLLEFIEEEEPVGLIQGILAKSREEWRVYKSLVMLKHRFIYQYQLFGGNVRGGQFVDFFVLTTVPFSTPVKVNGEHWHEGLQGSEDRLKDLLLEAELRGRANELVIFWGGELTTQEESDEVVTARIGAA